MDGAGSSRRAVLAAFVAVIVLFTMAAGAGPVPRPDRSGAPRAAARQNAQAAVTAAVDRPAGLDIYRGLGSWVDIYDYSALDDPEGTIASMDAHGVRTLYIETSNFRRVKPFVHREALDRFVDAAHDHGMAVVAWYLPGFVDPALDLRRSLKAIAFQTPSGERFDSFALDIESPELESPSLRTERLIDLSEDIRAAVGDEYPLGAIIPSPRGMVKHPEYWPGFPYEDLERLYDVFVPMTYFTWRTEGLDGAHEYTTLVTKIIRARTANPSVPIHVIGGISEEATTLEARGFVRAVRERGVIGGSFYGFPGTSEAQWDELGQIPVNPTQVPAMPVQLPSAAALGNLPGGDRTHPKEVFYRTGGVVGGRTLSFEVFDVQPGEVVVRVNWTVFKVVWRTTADQWSRTRTIDIPTELLLNHETNVISFHAAGNHPDWSEWGVRAVSLEAG